MTTYHAPIRDMRFAINELAGLESLAASLGYEELSTDIAEAILEEAA
ncbi:MAG: acyl-CoA dehydrogenase N-terminal domain-containing protein, partial [Acetobacteraceae bacterium]|nr:acyl-CoA dehydrogenase N-terminal domain-containing protein [Acetobacteraceae bacterium]